MASIIKIKNGTNNALVPTLAIGELAYASDNNGLYIGTAGGNVLVNPTSASTNGFTTEGGMYITLTNATGAASVKGTIVSASTSTNSACRITPANSDSPFGIVYDDGVADGSPIKVVVSGIAEVLLKNGQSSSNGYWCGVSDTAGRMYQTVNPPSTSEHNREIGHSIEAKNSGTNVLSKIVLHFN